MYTGKRASTLIHNVPRRQPSLALKTFTVAMVRTQGTLARPGYQLPGMRYTDIIRHLPDFPFKY